ncbi:hypothetical protein B4120_1817 [Bacillus cereus]|nr:hypothetical protein B4120_1817 [Bacillus cereus]
MTFKKKYSYEYFFLNELLFIFKPFPINDKPYRKQKMLVLQIKQLKQALHFCYVP